MFLHNRTIILVFHNQYFRKYAVFTNTVIYIKENYCHIFLLNCYFRTIKRSVIKIIIRYRTPIYTSYLDKNLWPNEANHYHAIGCAHKVADRSCDTHFAICVQRRKRERERERRSSSPALLSSLHPLSSSFRRVSRGRRQRQFQELLPIFQPLLASDPMLFFAPSLHPPSRDARPINQRNLRGCHEW